MLDAFGVDSSGPNPMMTRFTEGVTAGTHEQRDAPQATCDKVKEDFGQMSGARSGNAATTEINH